MEWRLTMTAERKRQLKADDFTISRIEEIRQVNG